MRSHFINRRDVDAVPYIDTSNADTGVGALEGQPLISMGNLYSNAASTGGSNAPGWIPVKVGTNSFMQPGGYMLDRTNNITSIGDVGTNVANSGNAYPLNNVSS